MLPLEFYLIYLKLLPMLVRGRSTSEICRRHASIPEDVLEANWLVYGIARRYIILQRQHATREEFLTAFRETPHTLVFNGANAFTTCMVPVIRLLNLPETEYSKKSLLFGKEYFISEVLKAPLDLVTYLLAILGETAEEDGNGGQKRRAWTTPPKTGPSSLKVIYWPRKM